MLWDIWNLTVNMSIARIHHTSTYIPETNSVLLAGGSGLISTETVGRLSAYAVLQLEEVLLR
jgi:hypothetical protein